MYLKLDLRCTATRLYAVYSRCGALLASWREGSDHCRPSTVLPAKHDRKTKQIGTERETTLNSCCFGPPRAGWSRPTPPSLSCTPQARSCPAADRLRVGTTLLSWPPAAPHCDHEPVRWGQRNR